MDDDDLAESNELPMQPPPDAAVIALLLQDHDEIRQLFQDLAAHAGADENIVTQREWMDRLERAMTLHASVEAEIFYPLAGDLLDDPELPRAAMLDHRRMTALLDEMRHLSPDDRRYGEHLGALQTLVERHLNDEENELFPLAGELLDGADDIVMRVFTRREQLSAELNAKASAPRAKPSAQEQSVAGEEDPGAGLDTEDAPRA